MIYLKEGFPKGPPFGHNVQDVHFRTAMDGGGSTQKRVRLRTRSPRMYTDVHFWARVVGTFFLFIEKKEKNSLLKGGLP